MRLEVAGTKLARLGCGLLVGLLVIGWISTCGKSKPHRSVGDRSTLYVDSGDPIMLAVDRPSFEELLKCGAAGDGAGTLDLLHQGRVFLTPNGTSVLVIDMAMYAREVRCLDGPHSGVSGWVGYEQVK